MANEEHLAILKQGVDTWNSWRKQHPAIEPELTGAGLSGMDLSGVDFYLARLHGVDLGAATLTGAQLSNARLSGAVLSGANLSKADLIGANLLRANLSGANLCGANLTGADLVGANLTGATFYQTNLEGTDFTGANFDQARLNGCRIYGISAWNLQGEAAEQANLIITPAGRTVITVDDIEVAQFVFLLLNHAKLRNVLNTVTKRGVLLLGRFGFGGIDLLHAMAEKLRELKYLPMIFDFDRPDDRDYTETIQTLAGLARFVIADLSGPPVQQLFDAMQADKTMQPGIPSVPHELFATVPNYDMPFVLIVREDYRPYAMWKDLAKYDWVVVPPVVYPDQATLIAAFEATIITQAEKKYAERQARKDAWYQDG